VGWQQIQDLMGELDFALKTSNHFSTADDTYHSSQEESSFQICSLEVHLNTWNQHDPNEGL
jgi:hypothetical protein